LNRKGQTTMEYVALWVSVAIATLVMSAFLKAHLQGRQKAEGEQLSTQLYIPGETDIVSSTRVLTESHSFSNDDGSTYSDVFSDVDFGIGSATDMTTP